MRALGLEVARYGVAVNAIAQNHIANSVYYPAQALADAKLVARMKKAIPARRFAKGRETAELVLSVCSDGAAFFSAR